MIIRSILFLAVIGMGLLGAAAMNSDMIPGQTSPSESPPALVPAPVPAPGSMTTDSLDTIVKKIDPGATRDGNMWHFSVVERPVYLVADPAADRMRVMSPIAETGTLPGELYERMMQANYDAALDARYAVAQNIVWSVFIHPLGSLTERELLSGTAQTVTAALNFGTSFSSGATVYGGGDSNGIIQRQLLDELLKKEGIPM